MERKILIQYSSKKVTDTVTNINEIKFVQLSAQGIQPKYFSNSLDYLSIIYYDIL